MKDLKVVFMGTPDFAVPILEKLITDTEVLLVVTQPDKVRGRNNKISFSPIKEIAVKNNIEVFQPEKIKQDYQTIIDKNPDIIITAAYGQIIPEELLFFTKYKAINVHASLLPKYRGGAPINRAIENGEKYLGITIMYMDKLMDNGDMISQRKIELKEEDNFDTMNKKLSILGRDLLMDTLPSIINSTNERIKQKEEDVTIIKLLNKEELLIDFNNDFVSVFNKIRSLDSVPGAYAFLNNKKYKLYDVRLGKNVIDEIGKVVDIKDYLEIACKNGTIKVYSIQEEGKKKMNIKDFFNGHKKEDFLYKRFNNEENN
ncbi:MAG: methionyl-tRNA formyltransferase [Clostridiales bacterium]|jgi:methionyl-tRNA formyltransferase|nr:methionyl-tRNA formyltransferase [Clostridiales bacterium]